MSDDEFGPMPVEGLRRLMSANARQRGDAGVVSGSRYDATYRAMASLLEIAASADDLPERLQRIDEVHVRYREESQAG